jgi:hypothetical protein
MSWPLGQVMHTHQQFFKHLLRNYNILKAYFLQEFVLGWEKPQKTA